MPASNEETREFSWDPSTQILQIVERFRGARLTGQPRAIDDFLEEAGPHRQLALVALVQVELESRLKAGEVVRVQDYLDRFPELAAQPQAVEALLAQARRHWPDGGVEATLTDIVRPFPIFKEKSLVEPLPHLALEKAAFPPPGEIDPEETLSPEAPGTHQGQAHPQTHQKGGPLLDSANHEAPTLPPEPSGPHRAGGAVPIVPGYEILGVLGRGGMGVVYKARHIQLNRLVALKMIIAGAHASPTELERFRIEAEAVARLQHPNIVQIYEIGERNGFPFFSLELVNGGSLGEKLKGFSLPFRQAAQLMESLARAMHCAHQLGIVHRDLKPGNILLARSDRPEAVLMGLEKPERFEPKVVDFGLAKKLDADQGQTQSGAIMGTPKYMAPEQAGGDGQKIGPATDIYALGSILYELLTGRTPFAGMTFWDTISQVLSVEPVPVTRLQGLVPHDLETICMKCLQKEPEKRYASAEVLAADLRAFLEGRPIQARPVGPWERAWKWARRRPAAAALVGLSAAAVVGLMVLLVWFNGYLQIAVDDARADAAEAIEERNAARSRERSATLHAEFQDLIRKGEKALADKDWQGAQVHLASALARIASEPSLQPFRKQAQGLHDRAKLQVDEDRARQAAGKRFDDFKRHRFDAVFHGSMSTGEDVHASVRQSTQAAHAALALYGVRLDREGPPVFGSHLSLEQTAEITDGCFELVLVLAENVARPRAGQTPAERKTQVAKAVAQIARAASLGEAPPQAYHLRRARYLTTLGDENGAKKENERAAARPPAKAFDYFLLGDEHYRLNRIDEAVAALERALRIQPGHFEARYFLSVCFLKQQRWALAKVSLTAAMAQQPAGFLWTYSLRGYAQGQLGEFQAAEEDFQKALDLKPEAIDQYGIHVNRGAMRLRAKKVPEAIADFEKAIALRPNHFQAHVNLARAYRDLKQWAKADAQLDEAFRREPELPALHGLRAQLAFERKDYPASLEAIDRALRLELKRADGTPQARAELLAQRGRLLSITGKFQDALTAFNAALLFFPALPDPRVHQWRGEALMELGSHAEAVRAFDRSLEKDKLNAAVYRARGLTQAKRGKYLEALQDYTMAIKLNPDAATYVQRGWEYLVVCNAPKLALEDFKAAIILNPRFGEGYYGRAYASVKLGKYEAAVADVQTGLAEKPHTTRLLWIAARVYAQAIRWVPPALEGSRPRAEQLRALYQDRAVELVAQALADLPEAKRASFWEKVKPDRELDPIRASAGFTRLEGDYLRLTKKSQ